MATFLAYAGLKRLGQTDLISQIIPLETMLPAPAQGAIGIETRAGDDGVKNAVRVLDNPQTHMAVSAERGFLGALNGSCRTPIAALAKFTDNSLDFKGAVFATDGRVSFRCTQKRDCKTLKDAQNFGRDLGTELKAEIGGRILWDEE